MSIAKIYQALISHAPLTALVPLTSTYSHFLPDGASAPAISFFLVSAPPINHLSGEATTENHNYQFDIWAERLLEAEAIIPALKAALGSSADFKAIRTSMDYDYDEIEKLHRYTLEFSIWF